MKKPLTIASALFLSIGLLAGCSKTGNEPTSAQQTAQTTSSQPKKFVFGDTTFNVESGEPNINPHYENSGWAAMRYGVGEAMFKYSEKMEIEHWLAESHELVNEKTWKIKLRDNITFTSGRKLDAQAAKESLEALVKAHARAAGNLKIDSITAEGQTLTIVTKEPVPSLPNYLADPYAALIDMQAGITPEGIVSATGPYKAVSLVSDEKVELVKNDNYWNGKPKIDNITVRTISDGDTMTLALQSGEIDAAYGMPYASYPLFQNDKYKFTSTPTSRAFFLWMNFKDATIQDPAVRKAIAMGLNKEVFVSNLLKGNGYPAAGVFPDSFPFGGEKAVSTEKYDPEAAQKLLEEAGWKDSNGDGIREKNGKPLVIRWLTYPNRQELPLLAEFAQAELKKLGMKVDINNTADHNKIITDTNAWNVYASAMITAPTGDPEYFFTYATLGSSTNNKGHYRGDKLEELAKKISASFDRKEREQLAVQMQQAILDDNAYVFVSHLRMSMIHKANVSGLKAHPSDFYEINVDLDVN
ncbi:MAG: ABC transporter substrate-binding protein [Brachymonas sp.]|nr:ABC transporter substrate-binding protein [Brachymonas sp.]